MVIGISFDPDPILEPTTIELPGLLLGIKLIVVVVVGLLAIVALEEEEDRCGFEEKLIPKGAPKSSVFGMGFVVLFVLFAFVLSVFSALERTATKTALT